MTSRRNPPWKVGRSCTAAPRKYMRRRNAAAAHLHDSPIQPLPTPPMQVDHTNTAGGACSKASSSHGGMQADAAAASHVVSHVHAHGGGAAISSHTCVIQSPMVALPTPPMVALPTPPVPWAVWSPGSRGHTTLDLAPCMASTECDLMERIEHANMRTYPRLGAPFNAYFLSYERAVYRRHSEGGELVAFAIADTSRPRLLVVRLHELQVEQSCRRQKHATQLVHAIEEGVPAGCALEVHVHTANFNALSFYTALNFKQHAHTDDGMLVLRRVKPDRWGAVISQCQQQCPSNGGSDGRSDGGDGVMARVVKRASRSGRR